MNAAQNVVVPVSGVKTLKLDFMSSSGGTTSATPRPYLQNNNAEQRPFVGVGKDTNSQVVKSFDNRKLRNVHQVISKSTTAPLSPSEHHLKQKLIANYGPRVVVTTEATEDDNGTLLPTYHSKKAVVVDGGKTSSLL